jgi:hypothetical protein
LLQFLGYTDPPAGNLKLRYKLAQDVAGIMEPWMVRGRRDQEKENPIRDLARQARQLGN